MGTAKKDVSKSCDSILKTALAKGNKLKLTDREEIQH